MQRDGKGVGGSSYAPGYEKMLALVPAIFPNDDELRVFVEQRQAQRKQRIENLTRWQTAQPEPLRALVKRKEIQAVF